MTQRPERAEALLRDYRQLVASVRSVQSASGTAGVVTVTIDGDRRVSQVQIPTSWNTSATAAELAGQVNEAYVEALNDWTRQWAEVYESPSTHDVTVPPPPTPAAVHPNVVPRGRAGDSFVADSMNAVGGLGGAATELLDQILKANNVEYTYRGSAGRVTVMTDGAGNLRNVTLDESWAKDRPGPAIADEFQSALMRAAQGDDRPTQEQIVAQSRLGRLLKRLTDAGPATSEQTKGENDDNPGGGHSCAESG